MGAPKSELMVFMGNAYTGICATMSQISMSDAPQSALAGSKMRWLEVRKSPRAI